MASTDSPAASPRRIRIGVDLGGTKTEAIVIETSGDTMRELARERRPTPASEGYEAIVRATADLARDVAKSAAVDLGVASLGVGMPGNVERRTGLTKNSNTVSLNKRPFRADLVAALGHEIVFENDANCFALAETLHGAAKAYSAGIVFGVIMGTGVGGGVIVHGRVHSGAQGIAGEWGHHAVWSGPEARDCYCGQRGCLEAHASGPALEASYARRTGRHLHLREIVERRATDEAAREVIEELIDAFGRGLANLIDILDPDAVVLGGGLSNLSLLYDEGRARVARYVFNDELTTPIVANALGDSAGVIGAALLGG